MKKKKKSKKKRKKTKRLKQRNAMALPARMRKAGPMTDRRIERGGSKNTQTEYLSEVE